MFDIGFWELLLIAVVALLVIGPERLPGVAQTAGRWIGRGRRMIMDVKADIDKEMKAEELKKILDQQRNSNPLEEIVEETRAGVEQIRKQTESTLNSGDSKQEKPPS